MGDALPSLGGLSVNAPPGRQPPPPPTSVRDLPLEITDAVLASYLAKLEVGELCEANLLQICMLLRGTNQCNDPNDPLWKAACARFGLAERLVGGTPDAPATPTWHVTFLAMCKEVGSLEPSDRVTYEWLLRGNNAFTPFTEGWHSTIIRDQVLYLWIRAAEHGLLCTVHYLLGRVDGIVNGNWYKVGTALMAASRGGHLDVVDKLLAKGADVNASQHFLQGFDFGRTALDEAIQGRHVAVVMALVAAGANVTIINENEESALYAASAHGLLPVVEFLLAHGADVDAGSHERTPLMGASYHGHLAIVEVLLANGADVHAGDAVAPSGWRSRRTALADASANGHLAVVEVLLAHGADVHAAEIEDGEFFEFNRGAEALQRASENGHLAVVEALLAHGLDVREVAVLGRYRGALCSASYRGHLAVVEVLLAHGADVHVQNDAALMEASEHGHLAVVEVLLAHGANVHARDHNGLTPLMKASEHGHLAIVEVLIAHGADVNAEDRNGLTALSNASWYGHLAVVEVLLANGADVHARKKYWDSALIHAIRRGNTDIVQVLLANGADVHAHGKRALKEAEQYGRTDIVEALLAAMVVRDVRLDDDALNAAFSDED